jgi:ABC-type sulfate/molybdate transport systems ATPase subunit
MNNLALPEIVPAAPVNWDAAANARLGVGQKMVQATDTWDQTISDRERAATSVQAQEATLQTQRGLDDLKQFIKSNPYLSQEQVKALFPNGAPEGLRLTQKTASQDGQSMTDEDRPVIPMHEVAPYIFEQQAKRITESATQQISGFGWQERFRQAAAADTEKARVDVMDWRTAQFMADMHIQTMAQLQQAAGARAWDTYQTILDNPHNMLDVKAREELRANLPRLRTKATIDDALLSRDPATLNDLLAKLDVNEVGGAKNGFYAALTSDEQVHYQTMAYRRLHEAQNEQDRAERRAEEKRFEAFGQQVMAGVAQSQQTGEPLSKYVSIADIAKSDIKATEKQHWMNFLAAMGNKERQTDPGTWLELDNLERTGKLGDLTPAQIYSYGPRLSDQHFREWMDRWAKAKGPNGSKPIISEREDKIVDQVLTNEYHFDQKKDGSTFNAAKAELKRNLEVYRKANPDKELDYSRIASQAALFSFNGDKSGSLFGLLGATDEKSWWKKFASAGDARATALTLITGLHDAVPGRMVSDRDLLTHFDQMEQERPEVENAWKRMIRTPIDGTARAAIHVQLVDPNKRAVLDQELATLDHKEPTQQNRIWRAIKDMQPPQDLGFEAQNTAKATAEAKARDTQAAGAEMHAEQQKSAAEAKAAKKAREDAEMSKPQWEREVDTYAKTEWASEDAAFEGQIRARVYAEDRADQLARAKGRGFMGGDAAIIGRRFADDPVRIEMEKRIRAESAVSYVTRRGEFDAQMAETKRAYERYFKSKAYDESGAPRTVLGVPMHDALPFEQWLEARRQGKL